MDDTDQLERVHQLGGEIASKIFRAIAYLRHIKRDREAIAHRPQQTQIIEELDRVLGENITRFLANYCSAKDVTTIVYNKDTTDFFLNTLTRLDLLELLSFSRLKHLSPTVELSRFARVIEWQIVHLKGQGSTVPRLGDSATARQKPSHSHSHPRITITPVDCSTDILLSLPQHGESLFNYAAQKEYCTSFEQYLQSNSAGFFGCAIGIKRMDSINPLRWPSVVHEVAHAISGDQGVASELLLKELHQTLTGREVTAFADATVTFQHEVITQWLHECWCDLFGAISFGPAFFRAQSIALLHVAATDPAAQGLYPPPLFRLHLMWAIIKTRFPAYLTEKLDVEVSGILNMYAGIELYRDYGITRNVQVRKLFCIFYKTFLQHFFVQTQRTNLPPRLKDTYRTLIAYIDTNAPSAIDRVTDELQSGNPVPTVKASERNAPYQETLVAVQELLIANWKASTTINRQLLDAFCDQFKNDPNCFIRGVLHAFAEHSGGRSAESLRSLSSLFDQYDRLDDATLRSLQISEWAHYLRPKGKFSPPIPSTKIASNEIASHSRGPLVDREILHLLETGELRIIPLVDWTTQLGSSSIDVRIGPTFEITQPRLIGTHIQGPKTHRKLNDSSSGQIVKIIDLDLGEYFVIPPGHFALGHTLEYFVFPDYILGELQGRSSFARLGLEIHRTASFIDNGFVGCITLELYNAGSSDIRLTPGERIAQLRLYNSPTPARPYSKKVSAKYGKLMTHAASKRGEDVEAMMIRRFRKRGFNSS